MKFNKTLEELSLPEWRVYFIDYKALKTCIRTLASLRFSERYENLCETFDNKLESELEKVVRFYEMKIAWSLAQITKHQRALSAVVSG